MLGPGELTTVVLGLAAFSLLTATLYVLARAREDESRLAALKREVVEVRRKYAERLAEMAGRSIMVEEIDTGSAPASPARPHNS